MAKEYKLPYTAAEIDESLGKVNGLVSVDAKVGQTIVVKAVDESGKPTEWEAADMTSGEWTLLYDGSVTIEEPVKNIFIPLLESCEGMTEFYRSIAWTANTNTETGNDNLAVFIGKFGMSYGRVGDATNATSVIFGGEVVADRTNWWKIQEHNSMQYNLSTPQCGYTLSNFTTDYNNVKISPFSIAYSGTFTLKIYGR